MIAKRWFQEALLEALEPVKGYFRGSEVTRNTVLAAHMRARSLRPTGTAWSLAKAALDADASFSEAAALADVGGVNAVPQGMGHEGGLTVSGASEPNANPMPVPQRTDATRASPHQVSPSTLSWFPKKFGPGDMSGEGAQRLLGTPNIPLASVLVREMAQNSWDARTAASAVRFTMDLRRLDDDQVRVLREEILTGDVTGLGVKKSLAKDEIWVLEIADRGTKGLGGPVRNDVSAGADQVKDFVNLILTLGAPRDVNLGAGTYGFGKTVAYQASSCGTVLFWSRSREESGIEDRFIGSAFGNAFSSEGLEYTGRHWWGVTVADRVEPMRGGMAASLGNAVFAQGFGEDETGTSMLIIDPDLDLDSYPETAAAIAEAALWNLWPKMVEAGASRTQMVVETLLNGEMMSQATPEDHPLFAGFSDALLQVRSIQSDGSYTPMFNTSTHEVWLKKPRTLLGHLALTRFPFEEGSNEEDDVRAFGGPAHHVALMRHDAELVVRYLPGEPVNSPGFQWVGVFKPTSTTDNSFADAEPPAHDDWSPAAIQDKRKRSEVTVALRRIKTIVADFLGPLSVGASKEANGRSVAALADRLSGLLGGIEGSAATRRATKPRGGAGPRRASARVQRTWSAPMAGARRIMALAVTVDGATHPVPVRAEAGVGVEGAMDHDESRVIIRGWVPGGSSPDLSIEPVTSEPEMTAGETRWLILEADSQVSVDVNLRVGDGSP